MVHGLEKFFEYFVKHTDQYVFIGGTACAILMNDLGISFRATKDLDIVLIIEALDSSFGETFWKFIADGGYECREKSDGKNQFYRFTNPSDQTFPKMIELFAKRPGIFGLEFDNGLTPIHIDDNIASLSAILLNDIYYDFLVNGRTNIEGFSVINLETIIVFKIKAWLDLIDRRESGENVDSRNIRKHKNDVFRLLAIVNPSARIETAKEIKSDIGDFIGQIKDDNIDLKILGIRGMNTEEALKILGEIFLELDLDN